MQFSLEQQESLLNIARDAIRRTLSREPLLPPKVEPGLDVQAGCFVTLHERGTHQLRGCIGRMRSEEPLAQTVQDMAVGVLQDPRFGDWRVQLDDLIHIDIDLSVLSPPVPAKSPLDFEPLENGIYLTIANRTGCFLPQVARETGWTREQLLARLCTEKMGLSPTAWQSGARLETFTATIIGPVPF